MTGSLVAADDETCRPKVNLTRLSLGHWCMKHVLLACEAAIGYLVSDAGSKKCCKALRTVWLVDQVKSS